MLLTLHKEACSARGSVGKSSRRSGSRRTSVGCTGSSDLSALWITDVLLCCLSHPEWKFVFQPKYAAYLNLIEPWLKLQLLKSSALKACHYAT